MGNLKKEKKCKSRQPSPSAAEARTLSATAGSSVDVFWQWRQGGAGQGGAGRGGAGRGGRICFYSQCVISTIQPADAQTADGRKENSLFSLFQITAAFKNEKVSS